MTTLAMVVRGERLAIELDTAGAPGLTAALGACLPHATFAIHTQTAGAEFCVPVPFFHWHENRRVPVPGEVGYASFGNYVCFYHGAMLSADGPTNVIGRVRDLGSLARIADRLLTTGAAPAHLISSDPTTPPGPMSGLSSPAHFSSFVNECNDLLKSVLSHPPLAIKELRETKLPAMGNLAGRLQASGFLTGLAESLFLLRRRLANSVTVPVPILEILLDTLGHYAPWLEMCGMRFVAGRLAAIAHCVTQDISRDELLTGIETLLVAVSRLRLWADAISPWHAMQPALADETWLAPDLWAKVP
jgi:hypothetical protein